ncbi:hypothetical protein LPB138_03825 [Urechidicola croceus]|uniref:Prenyltransferase n=2 Tax=Urechidicola croceus TaxID=1850246 RepID=A0A1D8PBR3_9FLAO|nr:hypothetical protein LPB138_03825 [Urechidicola croceus]
MIGITQILIKYVFFVNHSITSSLNNLEFILLTLSTLLITAGGYVINDIFDVNTDLINKPHKVFIGQQFSIKKSKSIYLILTSIGILIGTAVSIKVNQPFFSLIFILISVVLFYYSKKIKQVAFIGNITVAILIGLSIFLVGIFDLYPNLKSNSNNYQVLNLLLAYSLFSISINLDREIIKDIEDVDGDYAQKMKTLPILIGRKRTKKIAFLVLLLHTFTLFTVSFLYKEINPYIFIYALVVLMFPLLYLLSIMYTAKKKSDYKKISTYLKIIMLLGIPMLFVL